METHPGVNRLQLVRWQFGTAWASLELQLEELTDDECLWEPARPCWNVRRRPDGGWSADWQVPIPEPQPITSIGWRTWQIGSWWSHTYTETFQHDRSPATWPVAERAARPWAGPEQPQGPDVAWPGDAELTAQWLHRLHTRWSEAIYRLAETDLDGFDRSVWLQRGTMPLDRLLAWVNSELTKNAAEIGLLRRLYASAGYR